MCNKKCSNLFFLVMGAAVGATVGYVAASDKKEEWMKEVNTLVDKLKGNVNDVVNKAKQCASKSEEAIGKDAE